GNDYNLSFLLKSPKPAAQLPITDASSTVSSGSCVPAPPGVTCRSGTAPGAPSPAVFIDAAEQLDWDIHYVDGTIVRAHQHAAGAPTGNAEAEALGRSQGGFSTKSIS